MKFKLLLVQFIVIVVGCTGSEEKIEGRWFTATQVSDGAKVFRSNCASCHGENAQGLAANWKKPLADGSYPPPPLNGSAHTWHHPYEQLVRTIREGGIAIGGKMPPFADKLDDKEIDAVIAFFQSKWNDEIYKVWEIRSGSG